MSDELEIIRDEDSYLPEITHEDREGRRRAWRIAGVCVLAVAVVVWLAVAVIGRIALWREAGPVYRQLQASARVGTGLEADIHAFGASLTPGQVRALVSGRTLSNEQLRDDQRRAFTAIRPLTNRRAPALTPYRVLLRVTNQRRELHLVWQVSGAAEAVERSASF